MWASVSAAATSFGLAVAAKVGPWVARKGIEEAKRIFEHVAEEYDLSLDNLMQVYDDSVFERFLQQRTLALGETYMEGLWEPREDLTEFFYKIIIQVDSVNPIGWSWKSLAKWGWDYSFNLVFNPQNKQRAEKEAQMHYELGLILFKHMLDRRMIYSSGLWSKDVTTLDEAQEAKLKQLIIDADITPGERILDLGCGWGGTAKFLAEQVFESQVVGITNSREQYKYAMQENAHERVTFHCRDYREMLANDLHYEHSFDAILCIDMLEHIGPQNYRTFFEICRRLLKPKGKLLLQTVGARQPKKLEDPWLTKYIYPCAHMPALSQITGASEDKFVIEDVANYGLHFHRTLEAWYSNFETNYATINQERVHNGKLGLDEQFKRMWTYYLKSASGLFKARELQLYQLVLSPRGFEGGYERK